MFTQLPSLVLARISDFLKLSDLFKLIQTSPDLSFLEYKVRNHPSLRAQWKRTFEKMKHLDKHFNQYPMINDDLLSILQYPKNYMEMKFYLLGLIIRWSTLNQSLFISLRPYGHATIVKTIIVPCNELFQQNLPSGSDNKNLYFGIDSEKTLKLKLHDFFSNQDTYFVEVNSDKTILESHSDFYYSIGTLKKGINFNHLGLAKVWNNGFYQLTNITKDCLIDFVICQNSVRYLLYKTTNNTIFIYDFKKLLNLPIKQTDLLFEGINVFNIFYWVKSLKKFYFVGQNIYEMNKVISLNESFVNYQELCSRERGDIYCPFEEKCENLNQIREWK